jgi:hypothetical protein
MGGNKMSDDALLLNLEDVDENPQFEVMPKGKYSVIVEEISYGTSSTGNPLMTSKLKVFESGEFDGRLLWNHMALHTEFGRSRLKKFLMLVSPEENLAAFDPNEFANSGRGIGVPLIADVAVRSYEGKPTNNVKDILPYQSANSFLGGMEV